MNDNARTLLLILAAMAFVVSMFLGALTAPLLLVALTGMVADATSGDAQAIAVLGLVILAVVVAVLNLRRGWARIVLAAAAGLTLGSLAPPMSGAVT